LNWKCWKKGAHGRADDWNNDCKKKRTAAAEFFPQSGRRAHHRRKETMHLRTVVGTVELEVWRGKDPQAGRWGIPIREVWGLSAGQRMSPALEEKLVFTATLAGSYEGSAQVAGKWGCPVDDSVIHALVQRLGERAEAQVQARLQSALPPQKPQPGRSSELGVLMLDGWFARFRGPGWGQKKSPAEHVEWHEIKTGIFYLQERAARTESGRGMIVDKAVVRWQGEALELGRRLQAEALSGGLARAQTTLVVGDGIPWIWKLKAERWAHALELLDFWHGSQHLWALGRACHGPDEAVTQAWVERCLHRLRHGREKAVLKEIAGLKGLRGERGKIVRRERNYFASHAGRMHYQAMADRGWPIGSGPVESTCRQDQCRFKRPGQFWTQKGFRHLSALDEARRNNHWDEIWLTA
jgi:hypothetical protein